MKCSIQKLSDCAGRGPAAGAAAAAPAPGRGTAVRVAPNLHPKTKPCLFMQGVGELLGQPQQRRRLAASTAQPGRVNGTQFDLSSIDAGLGANAAATCTPSVACNASWSLPAAAVVDIYAINSRGGAPVSMGLCTGARPGAPERPVAAGRLVHWQRSLFVRKLAYYVWRTVRPAMYLCQENVHAMREDSCCSIGWLREAAFCFPLPFV